MFTFSSWSHFQGVYSKEKYVSHFVTVKRIMGGWCLGCFRGIPQNYFKKAQQVFRHLECPMLKSTKQISMEQDDSEQYSKSQHNFLPIVFILTMVCAFFVLDAVLPLQDLMFPDALLAQLG